jgi:hypothetical protein
MVLYQLSLLDETANPLYVSKKNVNLSASMQDFVRSIIDLEDHERGFDPRVVRAVC